MSNHNPDYRRETQYIRIGPWLVTVDGKRMELRRVMPDQTMQVVDDYEHPDEIIGVTQDGEIVTWNVPKTSLCRYCLRMMAGNIRGSDMETPIACAWVTQGRRTE